MKPSILLGKTTHQDITQLLFDKRRLLISGAANETAKTLLISTFLNFQPVKTLIVTENNEQLTNLVHWLEFFEKQTQTITLQNEEINQGDLLRFISSKDSITVCTHDVWHSEVCSFNELEEGSLTLTQGQTIEFTKLVEKLISLGYEHGNDLVLEPGQYRRTGDSLDIFPLQHEHPYRVNLNFDTIESIYKVDRYNAGSTKATNESLVIYPAATKTTTEFSKQLPSNVVLVLDDQDDIETPLTNTTLRFTPFPEDQDHHVHMRYLSVLKFYTLTDFLNDLRDKIAQKWSLVIVSKRAKELEGIFKEEHIPYNLNTPRENAITIIPAEENDLLPHSLQNPELNIALLTDREIFSLKKAGKNKSVQKLALDFVTSLTPGDYIVHLEHGIGHFEGMTQKEIDSTLREYLEIHYAEGDKLFIPVHQADKLSKFVYEEGDEPKLTRLGTQEWKKATAKAAQETKKIAKELLKLYAERAKARGHKYDDDNQKQKDFEKAFPYQETPGQMKAIEDIKNDMEREQPMDRLICGDVGFGKTEIAMRAAFKAVQSGKQVAVLAPITILVDQHFKNFQERMAGFNIRIGMLSRFRTPAQQRETIEQARKGDIDIVVGTHRLLQPDVKFHNLGMVIIDEEQRFGVKQKEALKNMRASVDILTLTATPIPRTLNLGLHKLRDITTITTPPPGRLPIITEVRKFSEALIIKAIRHELERDGQVYVLHNRVETIGAFAEKLQTLIPEGKFIVAHGQLKPEDLEKRITAFKKGEYNVLVSSTIVENGIDLPNANTLIINKAENFGLSQLYQLRGRVGRGKRQAFAYFLYHGQKLKDDARKRLRAIVEACELGSGFQVAMRDLEIRGAGEILGSHQAGSMNTVGVSHYLRMLKKAVAELEAGNDVNTFEEINTEILLPIEALIPSYYIPDMHEKISIYQKLAGSTDEEILKEFEQDLIAEYGQLPEEVLNLFAVLRLKLACRYGRIAKIKQEVISKVPHIVLTFSEHVMADHIIKLIAHNPKWQISGMSVRLPVSELTSENVRAVVHGYLLRRFNTEVNPSSCDAYYCHRDIISDPDTFIFFSTENQHVGFLPLGVG